MNVFALGATCGLPRPGPPSEFNVKLSRLKDTYAAALTRAVDEGRLDAYTCEGELWVSQWDVQNLVAAGHCTYDPDDACCFIAPNLTLADGDDPARILSIT